MPADEAITLHAQELEQGSDDSEFDGQLGDGAGKWKLLVSADQPIQVMSLLLGASGHLTNLSTSTIARGEGTPAFAPADEAAFDALFIGKVMIAESSEDESIGYFRFLGDNRYTDTHPEDGLVETGRYTYRGTGPNSGTLEATYDEGSTCTASMMFSSATEGTLTTACDSGYRATGTWTAVWSPSIDDFAPADHTAFEALFVGRAANTNQEGQLLIFVDNRFVDVSYDDNTTLTGSYTYEKTDPNVGIIKSTVDDTSAHCVMNMVFSSATGGSFRTYCNSSLVNSGMWWLVDISTIGIAPENQEAFDALFIGKRWLVPTGYQNSEEVVLTDVGHTDFVSPGRFVVAEYGENLISATEPIRTNVRSRTGVL